jgi:sRNA-binding protein
MVKLKKVVKFNVEVFMNITIDKKVPMPKPRVKKEKKKPKSDIAKAMNVGDSVFIETLYGHKDNTVTTIRKAMARFGMKYTCRKLEGGVRIWRIE